MKCLGIFVSCFLVGVSANTGLNVVDTARRMGIVSYLFALDETNNVDFVATTQNITVFIPTNDAFKNVDDATRDFWRKNPTYYSNLMRYHVVKGKFFKQNLADEDVFNTFSSNWTSRFVDYTNYSKVQVYDGSVIRQYDINCSNGVIHLIDQVASKPQTKTILQIVQNRTDLTKIVAAIKQIDNITDTLSGMTAVTFLAPSDEAIGKLAKGVWDRITKDNETLKEILQYNVLNAGTWFSRGLTDGLNVTTLNKNANMNVTINDKGVFFNKARVTDADLAATNGVVHVIDTVLFPPDSLKKLLKQ